MKYSSCVSVRSLEAHMMVPGVSDSRWNGVPLQCTVRQGLIMRADTPSIDAKTAVVEALNPVSSVCLM